MNLTMRTILAAIVLVPNVSLIHVVPRSCMSPKCEREVPAYKDPSAKMAAHSDFLRRFHMEPLHEWNWDDQYDNVDEDVRDCERVVD